MSLNVEHTKEIDRVNFRTERIERRAKTFRETKSFISGERARLLTESWHETEGEPTPIRRAKGFAKFLDGIPVLIRDGELIVGSQAERVLLCTAYPEWDAEMCLKEFGTKTIFSMERDNIEAETDEKQRQVILETARFWKGKSVVEKIDDNLSRLYGNRMKELFDARVFYKPFINRSIK